jgi:hypothetical protein
MWLRHSIPNADVGNRTHLSRKAAAYESPARQCREVEVEQAESASADGPSLITERLRGFKLAPNRPLAVFTLSYLRPFTRNRLARSCWKVEAHAFPSADKANGPRNSAPGSGTLTTIQGAWR